MASGIRMLGRFAVFILLVGSLGGIGRAELIQITTPVTITSQLQYSFGDYRFRLVNPGGCCFNLVAFGEGFIVSNIVNANEFVLERIDGGAFDLLGIRHAGVGTGIIAGSISVPHNGNQAWQDLVLEGMPGVSRVQSILFSPNNAFQISSFEVRSPPIPEPGTVGLLGIGVGVLLLRRRSGLSN